MKHLRGSMIRRSGALAGCVALALAAAACSNVRESLGLEPKPPDEFTVVRKAPLTIPPDFNLRPPRPGAARPQEIDPRIQAQAALGGSGSGAAPGRPAGNTTVGEQALLRQAGGSRTNAAIREVLNGEDAILNETDVSFVDRLIFWRTRGNPDVLNPTREQQRVRQQTAAANATPEQEAPIIRRKGRSILSGIF